jgi:hypothetical protein
MSKQTVLQELRFFVSDGLNDYDESIKVSEIWDKINQLLEKEKQQIKDAYSQGDEDGFHSTESQADYEIEGRSDYVSEQYFQSVYGQS